MTKKQMATYTAATIEHYLDQLQELTNDYMRTFELWEMPTKDIVLLPNDEMKLLICALNVCKNAFIYKEMEVKFSGGTFHVKIKLN